MTTPIVEVRNAVEHMDEKIQEDSVQENEPVMLKMTDTQDGVVIRGQSLKFSTLSTLIKRLHGWPEYGDMAGCIENAWTSNALITTASTRTGFSRCRSKPTSKLSVGILGLTSPVSAICMSS